MNSLIVFALFLCLAILALSPLFLVKSLRQKAKNYLQLKSSFIRFKYYCKKELRLIRRADRLLQRTFDDGRALSKSNHIYMQSQAVSVKAIALKRQLDAICEKYQQRFPSTVLSIQAKIKELV